MANRRLDDRYELRERVGSGGMAEVWEGFDHNLSRRIAIKMLHSHLAADRTVLARFRSEAQAAARLTHPAVVAIYDTVGAEENHAIIMEFVEGRDLRTILNERPTLAAADAVEVGFQLASALGHAHQNGIVHRDVKPANILVRPDRRVKLSDFGIAKALDEAGLTETGSLVGTVKYLAPEQLDGHPVDGRTDLYGLSTVLYEMLCGQVPFAATDLRSAMERLRKDPPSARKLRPDLPLSLDAFLVRSLARKPDDRYPDAAAWSAALKEAMLGGLMVDRGDATIVDSRPKSVSIPLREEEPTSAEAIPEVAPRPPVVKRPEPVIAQDNVWSTDIPPARPTAKQRAKVDPANAKHVKAQKSGMRWLAPMIALFLMLAAVATVWFLLTSAGDSLIEQFSNGDEPAVVDPDGQVVEDTASNPDAVPNDDIAQENAVANEAENESDLGPFGPEGLRATSFDPFGDGEEHEEAVLRPFDGDPNTFWFTQLYRDRTFGQLKPGVGLIVEFDEARSVDDVNLVADRQDWAVEIYAADTVGASLDDWGSPIGTFSGLGTSESLDIDDTDTNALLLWVTDLGIDAEQTIDEHETEVQSGEILQIIRISEVDLVG